jgi:DNA-binding phage protein
LGSNPSKATLDAIEMVKRGMKPIEAARKAGIHRDTLYKSKLYKDWKKKLKK